MPKKNKHPYPPPPDPNRCQGNHLPVPHSVILSTAEQWGGTRNTKGLIQGSRLKQSGLRSTDALLVLSVVLNVFYDAVRPACSFYSLILVFFFPF